MLKLLPWRLRILQAETLTTTLFPKFYCYEVVPPRFPLVFSRFLSKSPSDDTYDPPFSPLCKSLKPNPKAKKKKKGESRNRASSERSQDLPAKSDLPFDFRYSYSETNPSTEPIGFREPPRFSPFGPGRLDRKWTGTCAPVQHHPIDFAEVAERRKSILGEPLSDEEIAELVERFRHSDCSRQINLGFLREGRSNPQHARRHP